jgi:hypothetical protein
LREREVHSEKIYIKCITLITFEMAKAQKGSSKSGGKRVGMLDSCDY